MIEAPVCSEPRTLSPLILLAILYAPLLFVWLLLSKGYSKSLRQAGFIYAFAIGFLPWLIFMLLDDSYTR